MEEGKRRKWKGDEGWKEEEVAGGWSSELSPELEYGIDGVSALNLFVIPALSNAFFGLERS